jgi:hypothetical protein
MNTIAHDLPLLTPHPVDIRLDEPAAERNRLTVAFRPLLALPHLLMVGAPIALAAGWTWRSEAGGSPEWSVGGGGVLGAVAGVSALLSWFAIVFTGTHPEGLRSLALFYLRWRVRAIAYMALLVDDYPPFGDAPFSAEFTLASTEGPRDRWAVAFRILLAIPQLLVLCALSAAWALVTVIAWCAILVTGRYPHGLWQFARDVFRWSVRVEAYLLLLHDEYPPFRLGS